MTPRGTDWSLAVLVTVLVATGLLSVFAGTPSRAWVFSVHDAVGFALAAVVVFKTRRVIRRVLRPELWDAVTIRGLLALAFVALALGTGIAWSTGAEIAIAGYNLLALHWVLGAGLGAIVLSHAMVRARRPRRADLADRRQALQVGLVAAGAFAAWRLQRPAAGLVGLRGERRRFTGSYEASSLQGNDFPTTSWVSDQPRPAREGAARVAVTGRVARELDLDPAALDAGDELVATLDCTGGFQSTQRWRGMRLGRLLDRAGGLDATGDHVSVVSRTGYRWGFTLEEARRLLLATHVGGEPLSHGHGAPVRLVAPGRRGYQWVKWVVRVEVTEHADLGAPASTLWSSLTAEGRGVA